MATKIFSINLYIISKILTMIKLYSVLYLTQEYINKIMTVSEINNLLHVRFYFQKNKNRKPYILN